jgi:hypothetical protein
MGRDVVDIDGRRRAAFEELHAESQLLIGEEFGASVPGFVLKALL